MYAFLQLIPNLFRNTQHPAGEGDDFRGVLGGHWANSVFRVDEEPEVIFKGNDCVNSCNSIIVSILLYYSRFLVSLVTVARLETKKLEHM
jgi:hypothetical protein